MKIIAEVGINHNGDIDLARKLIDTAYIAGCDYVKFQKRTVSRVYSKEDLAKPRVSPWGNTTKEQKEGIELEFTDYQAINDYCKTRIPWFASAWDELAVNLLMGFEPPFIKIASAMMTNEKVLAAVKYYDVPVILSTGMCSLGEIDKAVKFFRKDRVHCIMHCTSTYPTKTEEMNLRCITTLKERYPGYRIGFSNHHPGIIFMPAAVALGAEMVEFHITMDKLMYGSDQAASFNPEGTIKACKYMRDVEAALGDGVKKIYDSERPIREKLSCAQ